jgi:F-type H+-transporting ATPase subunit a
VQHPPHIFEFLESWVRLEWSTVGLTVALLALLAAAVTRSVKSDESLVPSERLTLRNVLEILLEGMTGLMEETIGPDWRRYAPLVLTLGLFVLISNLMGLVPFFTGPTTFLETNVSWAVLVFFTYNLAGFQKHGVGYLKQFLGPIPWLIPLMLPIELISHFARMLSLTVRLTANMFADHTLVAVALLFPVVQIFTPWVMMGLGLFVAFLQAFIFAYLTTVYIGQAVAEAH